MSGASERMYNLESTPPAGAWDRIAAALDAREAAIPTDEGISASTRDRLFNFEAAPPATAFAAVMANLSGRPTESIAETIEAAAPVIDLRSRFRVALRYAAVILLVAGGLAAGGYYLRSSGEDQAELTAQADADSTGPAGSTTAGLPDTSIAPPSNHLPLPDEQSHRDLAGRTSPGAPVISRNRTTDRNLYAATRENDALYAYEAPTPSIAERYVTLLTPDGSFIRMSKKLGSLICCVTGDEQDAGCKDQLKKLQEQIANSDAQSNVLDMLDLVNSLDNGTKL